MIQIIEKSMKKWYYILVKNKLYRLEKKMIDKEEIKKVSDTIEIVKSNIEEYEILYSNLLKGNADEQYIQNMSKEYSNKLKNLNKAISVPYFARIDFKENKRAKADHSSSSETFCTSYIPSFKSNPAI